MFHFTVAAVNLLGNSLTTVKFFKSETSLDFVSRVDLAYLRFAQNYKAKFEKVLENFYELDPQSWKPVLSIYIMSGLSNYELKKIEQSKTKLLLRRLGPASST